MRRAIVVALLFVPLAGVQAAEEGYHPLQNTIDTVLNEDFVSAPDWSTEATQGSTAGNAWRYLAPGHGDSKSAHAGLVASGSPDGYSAGANIRLISPEVDLTSARLSEATFWLNGDVAGTAALFLDVKTPYKDWTQVRSWDVDDSKTTWAKVDVTSALSSHVRDESFHLRFRFVGGSSDGVNETGFLVDDVVVKKQPFVLQNPSALFSDTFSTDKGWTAGGASGGNAWHKGAYGETGQGWYVGSLEGSAPNGSAGESTGVTLTSPVIDTTGKRLRGVSFDINGSTAGAELRLQWKLGARDWKDALTIAGTGYAAEGFDAVAAKSTLSIEQQFALLQADTGSKDARFRLVANLSDGDVGWTIDNFVVDAWTVSGSQGVTILELTEPDTGSISTVDVQDDEAAFVKFILDEDAVAASGTWASARVTLTHAGGQIRQLALEELEAGIWTYALPVSDPNLLVGAYSVVFDAFTTTGGHWESGARTLTVTATDDGAPRVSFGVLGTQVIGPLGAVQVTVEDSDLRSVTWQLPTFLSARALQAPYNLGANAFAEGSQLLTIRATDRSGHTTTATHVVLKDTTAPEVTTEVPTPMYQGLPGTFSFNVTDSTEVTITARIGSQIRTTTAAAGQSTATVAFTVEALGMGNMTATLTDAADNRRLVTRNFTVVPVVTDLDIVSLAGPSVPILAGDNVTIDATIRQLTGVTTIPVNATFTSGSATSLVEVDLAHTTSSDISWTTRLAPGRHQVALDLETLDSIVEGDSGRDQATTDVEVFLGKVTHGDHVYYIRISTFGLPLEAVDLETGETYRLSADPGSSTKYLFTVGDHTFTWDARMPVSEVPEEESNDDPVLGLVVMLLTMLGAAAWIQRRD